MTPAMPKKPPLHILHVTEPLDGGVWVFLQELIREQWAQGHRVSLVYSSRRMAPEALEFLKLVESRGGESFDLRVGPAPQCRDLFALSQLFLLFKEPRFDIVHAHSSKAGALTRLLKPFFRKLKLFYSPHAYYGFSQQNFLKNFFFTSIEKLLANQCPKIHISFEEDDYSKKALGTQVPSMVSYLPIRSAKFQSRRQSLEPRGGYSRCSGFPEHALILGWMGRLEYQKAPEIIFPYFKKLLEDRPEVHILAGGYGSLESELKPLFSELESSGRFRFVSRIQQPQKFFEEIDIFIMSTRYEAFGLVACEALMMNRPVVYSRAIGVGDLKRYPELAAESFDLDSISSLNLAITKSLERLPQINWALHHKKVMELFDSSEVSQKIDAFYRNAF